MFENHVGAQLYVCFESVFIRVIRYLWQKTGKGQNLWLN